MKTLLFIREIFKKFPLALILNVLLLLAESFFGVFSLFTISPVVDLFIHPNLQGVSPLTIKAISVVKFFGLPVTLVSWVVIFVLAIFLSGACQVFAKNSILQTKYKVMQDIILGTFDDFFSAQWYFFSSAKQGMLLNTFSRELTVVGDAFSSLAMFFNSILQAIFFLSVPFYISWQVTLISLSVALLFALPFILLGKLTYRLGKLTTATANQTSSVIQENLSLSKVVLGFDNQRTSLDNLADSFNAHCHAAIKSQTINILINRLYRPFGIVMVVIALFAARKFNVPLSEITVLLASLLQVAVAIGSLATQKNSLDTFFPSYEQIKDLRQRAKKLIQTSGSRQFEDFFSDLTIESVYFSYPGNEPTLIDINARIPKGKMVAFVGESGTGKSTLIDLIMGFYQPQNGRIVFDGISLQEFNIHSYRQKIGYVPQDSVLFNMSIRDNLLWARKSASDEEILQACRQANAEEFIRALPQGYNTLVGDRGVRLSGGQVQRLALARAILRNPAILILDEATSSLDTYSERLIQQAIEKIARETTVIAIAHRLSTILNADYIYVIKNSRIVEEGTYIELIKKNGYFNRMVQLQAIGTIA